MKECWINVYKYDMMNDCYVTGDAKFPSRSAALSYAPSWGLRLVYIIHVRMK